MDIKYEEALQIPKDVSPNGYKEVAVYKNVTVQILADDKGNISVGWMKQPDTETLYEREEPDA